EAGYEPMAVASLAVLLGTSESVAACMDLDELAAHFDPAAVSVSASRFDPAELDILNRAIVQRTGFEAVRERLAAFGIEGERAEAFWLAVRDNIDRVADCRAWWRIIVAAPERGTPLSEE